jgi:predicted ATPase/class 3 adenylate cyclase
VDSVPITVKNEDRRRITVLFIDMAGFTSFSELADPEQIRVLQREYFAALREVMRQYGGVIEKYIGDAVMAVFGAPVATEDDPLRAVRAGLEAQRVLNRGRLAQLATFRVGIATGEALVDLGAMREGGQAMVSGDVVATASRMQTIAPEGGVLVDDFTMESTKHEIEYSEQPLLTLRGRTTPRRLFVALSARSHRRDRDESTPMVDREHERGLLVTTLHRMLRDNSSQLVTIFGPAGIGKSRILRELARHAVRIPKTKITWRVGHCPPFGENVTYAALAEIVKAQLGILDTDDEATTRRRLDDALHEMVSETEADRLAEALGPLVGLPATGLGQDETELGWRRFVHAMATAKPTVLVFEDMHWAEEKMLLLVEILGNLGPGVPLMIVATARPELRERRPDWTSAVTGAVSVSLGPMHDEHIATLCELMVGQAVFPEESMAPLVQLAGGNPLYAHEFVRMLVEQGELRPIGEQFTLSDAQRAAMPQTVQAVIANRLDLLDATDRSVLQAAAVVGTQFWPGAVAAALGVSLEVVTHALQRLQQRDLVAEHGTSVMAGQLEYGFRHVLVRDVCYQRLPRSERVSRHQSTGDWLERVSDSNRASDLAEVLANHRWAAHEIARTLGMDTVPFAEPARTALSQAARRAYALHALDAAATLVDRALSIKLDNDPALELLAAELALFRDGDAFLGNDAGHDGMTRLSDLADRLVRVRDHSSAARAYTLLGMAAWARADRSAALSYLDEAVARYESLPESLEQAEALLELARVHMMNFEATPAIAAAEAAADIGDRLSLSEVHANARITSATARCLVGDPAGLSELEAVTAECRSNRLVSLRRAIQNLAWACLEQGDIERHNQLLKELRIELSTGIKLGTSFGDDIQRAYWSGDWRTLVTVAGATLRRPTAEWDPNSVLTAAWIRVLQDQPVDDAVIDSVLSSARQSGFHRPLRSAAAHGALVRAAQGRLDEAATLLSELDADWRKALALPSGEWVAAAAHAAHLVGAEARQRMRAMLELAPLRTPWVEAALATVDGDHTRAAERYGQIGDLSDRALSLAWAARAGGKQPDELRDFVSRNGAVRLP